MKTQKINFDFTTGKWGGFEMGDGEFFCYNLQEVLELDPDWFIKTVVIDENTFETTFIPNPINVRDTTGWDDQQTIDSFTFAETFRTTKEEVIKYLQETDKIGIWEVNHKNEEFKITDFAWYLLGINGCGKSVLSIQPDLHPLYNELLTQLEKPTMKTILPRKIRNLQEAKQFLFILHHNGESFHPEDDAFDVEWKTAEVSDQEKEQLNRLMKQIYNLFECQNYPHMQFDPCGFLLDLDEPARLTCCIENAKNALKFELYPAAMSFLNDALKINE